MSLNSSLIAFLFELGSASYAIEVSKNLIDWLLKKFKSSLDRVDMFLLLIV